MPNSLHEATVTRARSAIDRGDVDRGEWSAPNESDRKQLDCLGSDLSYPIFSGGKVNLKAVSSAQGYAEKNGSSEIAAASKELSARAHSGSTTSLSGDSQWQDLHIGDGKHIAVHAESGAVSAEHAKSLPPGSIITQNHIGGERRFKVTGHQQSSNGIKPTLRQTAGDKLMPSGDPHLGNILTQQRRGYAMGDGDCSVGCPGDGMSGDQRGAILRLNADLIEDGSTTRDSEGNPIYHRKALVAEIGEWTHRGSGRKFNITPERADGWIKNHLALSAAGVRPFMPTRHFVPSDGEDNYGYVNGLERIGNKVFAKFELHGDSALRLAAKNGRSIEIHDGAVDAHGKRYEGEVLHSLVLTPNPNQPGLGDMVRIAASADHAAFELPVFEMKTPHAAPGRKDLRMNPEIAQRVRRALALSADVTDDSLADIVGERAIALSVDLDTRSKELKAATSERDTAVTERDAAKKDFLALSADQPIKLDPINLSAFEFNVETLRENAIKAGSVSAVDAARFTKLFRRADGKPNHLALSASGENGHPMELNFWREIAQLATPIRTGHGVPRDSHGLPPALAGDLDVNRMQSPEQKAYIEKSDDAFIKRELAANGVK